jgi:hypothetical protein
MHYSIPKGFTTDGYTVNSATDLSLGDIQYIKRMYPKSSKLYPNEILQTFDNITSPNGKYSLTIDSPRLNIQSNEKPDLLYSITLRVLSSPAKLKFENSTLILYNSSQTRVVMGDPSLNADYVTITDSGDLQIIKEEKAIWSLFYGKL